MGSFTRNQHGHGTGAESITLGSNVSVGDIVVVAWGAIGTGYNTPGVPTSVTDDNGNVYTVGITGEPYSASSGNQQGICAIYIGVIASVTHNPPTITFSGYTNVNTGAGSPSIVYATYTPNPTTFSIFGGEPDQDGGGGVNGSVSFLAGQMTGETTGRTGFQFINSSNRADNTIAYALLMHLFSDYLAVAADYNPQSGNTFSASAGATLIDQTVESGGQQLGLADFAGTFAPGCGYIAPTLAMTCNNPPAGTQNVPYSWQLGPAAGGTPPYTYAITAGSLPTGITLDASTGIVSGTPTGTGISSFTITVTDSAMATASAMCSITINASMALSISCNNPPGGLVGTAYLHYVTASGGTSPYTFSLVVPGTGTLPPGLSLAATGLISGTPTMAGTYPFTVLVTDSLGAQATVNCSITISTPTPSPTDTNFFLTHVVVALKPSRLPVRGSST